MANNTTLSFGLAQPELAWSSDGTPFSVEHQQSYWPSGYTLAQIEDVFIAGNQLRKRFSELKLTGFSNGKNNFTIAETGFGSGLNFLSVCRAWDQTDTGDACLHFVSVENAPLCPQQLQRCFSQWPELQPYQQELLANYPQRLKGVHRVQFSRRIQLTLLFGEAQAMLPQLTGTSGFGVDAWFLDGFAPANKSDLWSQELFNQVARLSAMGTTFSALCSEQSVCDSLQNVGFTFKHTSAISGQSGKLSGTFNPDLNSASEPLTAALTQAPALSSAQRSAQSSIQSIDKPFEKPEQKDKRTNKKTNKKNRAKPWFDLPAVLHSSADIKKAVSSFWIDFGVVMPHLPRLHN